MMPTEKYLFERPRRSLSLLAACGILALCDGRDLQGATFTFNSTSATGAYLTTTNWTPSGPPGANDVALFNNAATNAGINFNGTTNGTSLGTIGGVVYGKNQAVGTVIVASAESGGTLTIGNSSGTVNSSTLNSTFTLNGTTVNGISNVVLQNASSATVLTLAGFASGITSGNPMSVNLGNITNNVVLIDGGSNIAISAAVISPVATNGLLTLSHSSGATGTGALVLSGANTYSGGTSVVNGNLQVTNTSGSGTGTGAVAIGTTGGGNAVLSGTGAIAGLVTTTTPTGGLATIAPGVNTNATTNFGGVGTLTLKGGLTVGGGTNFNFDLASTAAAGSSDAITLGSSGALTLASTLTFNYNLLAANNLATTAYTLISGATNTLSLTGVAITSTGLGIFTPTYSVSGGSLLVTFASSSTPNYFGTTGQGYNASSTVFDTTTADFNSTNTGSGTPKVFDSNRTAIFGGTSGPVTVATVTAGGGLQFTSSGYTLNGGSLTLATTPSIEVTNATDTATINTALSGTVGVTKVGAGTLVLGSSTSNFTGGVAINNGTLSVAGDGALGSTANAVTLGGGTLAATANFTTARAITGTGAIDVVGGGVLVATGTISTTGLTLTDTGTLDLQSATPSVGALTFTAGGTLASTTGGTVNLTSLSANLTGTATISSALSFTSITANVGAGAEVALSGALTSTSTLTKTGAGALDLTGANGNLFRVQLGNASVSTPTVGGTLNINNLNALGKNPFFLDNGTLNATADLTSATGNAIPVGVSLSGIVGSTAGGVPFGTATLTGSNLEFQGASNFYEVASQTVLTTVNNTTTLSGVVAPGGSTTGKGILLTSTNSGTLILSGAAPNTFIDPITIAGSATLVAAKTGALALNASVTVNPGSTLLLSGAGANRINDNAAILLAGGTYGSQGNSEVTGALTLTVNSNIDFGAGSNASVLTFADSSGKAWSGILSLLNYTDMADALNFGTSTTSGTNGGLTASQLGEITYTSGGVNYVGTGFDAAGDVTFTAVPEPTTVLGGLLLTVVAGWSQRRRLRGLALAA